MAAQHGVSILSRFSVLSRCFAVGTVGRTDMGRHRVLAATVAAVRVTTGVTGITVGLLEF